MRELTIAKQEYLKITEQPMAGSSLINWIRVLRDNQFSIDWQFFPRAFYVTCMISALTPFRFYESIKYNPKIKDTKVIAPLFIIGHWRSGTTFLHYLLGQDPQLGYVSTFETMTPGMIIANEDLFRNLVKNHLPSKRPMDDLEMHANLPYEEEYAIANISPYSFYLAWYFPRNWKRFFDTYVLFRDVSEELIDSWKCVYEFFLKKISYKNNENRIMLKSLVNTARIKLILDMFPDAKFIHIYRNPYEVYLSTWKLYKKILPIFSFQHISSDTLDEYILYSYKELYGKYFTEKHLISKENLVELSYDDFMKNPVDILQTTYEKLGIENFDKAKSSFELYAKKHENYKADTYNIKEDVRSKVYINWKDSFNKFGYKR